MTGRAATAVLVANIRNGPKVMSPPARAESKTLGILHSYIPDELGSVSAFVALHTNVYYRNANAYTRHRAHVLFGFHQHVDYPFTRFTQFTRRWRIQIETEGNFLHSAAIQLSGNEGLLDKTATS